MNPTQTRRYRHTMTIEFETTNVGLDDFSRALEPYTAAEARRFAEREVRDNAGISDQSAFKIVSHGVYPINTHRRKLLAVVRYRTCADCDKRRVCFLYRRGRYAVREVPVHPGQRWFCVKECADTRFSDGWRPVVERVY